MKLDVGSAEGAWMKEDESWLHIDVREAYRTESAEQIYGRVLKTALLKERN